jgi:hypothetical protein
MTRLCADGRQVTPTAVATQVRSFADDSVRFAVRRNQINMAEDQKFFDLTEA